MALLLTLGCAANVPRQELQQATSAYEAVAASSEPLLVELAAAERRNYLDGLEPAEVLRQEDVVVPRDFHPARAAYFSMIGEPALTAAVRRGLGVTGDYFRTLSFLAEGGDLETAKTQLRVLSRSVAALATAATSGAAAPMGAAALALEPLVDRWARAESAAELRRLVAEGAPKLDELLARMQDASTAMYRTLRTAPQNAAEGALLENPGARRAALLQIAEYNVMVSNFVQLLGGLRDATRSLAAAALAPDSGVTLASLAAASQSLLIDAQVASRAIAVVRTRGVTP